MKTTVLKALRRLNPPSSLKAARRAGVRLPMAWLCAVAAIAGQY